MATKDVTASQDPLGTSTGWLLSPEQRTICEQIAAGESPDRRRAQALLAVDGGASQAEAGRRTGLTRNQVQYCLHKFRQDGVAIFAGVAPEAPTPEPDAAPESAAGAGGAETKVEKPGKKAGGKAAKNKKGKKKREKKEKGGKKGRKSKSGKSSQKKGKGKGGAKKRKKKSKKKGKRS